MWKKLFLAAVVAMGLALPMTSAPRAEAASPFKVPKPRVVYKVYHNFESHYGGKSRKLVGTYTTYAAALAKKKAIEKLNVGIGNYHWGEIVTSRTF